MRRVIRGIIGGCVMVSMVVCGSVSGVRSHAMEQLAGSPIWNNNNKNDDSTDSNKSDTDKKDNKKNTTSKDEYIDDIQLYEDTGEILLFTDEYEGSFGSSEDVFKGRLYKGGIRQQSYIGDYIVDRYKGKWGIGVIDSTKSVKKVVVNGKKSYKLGKLEKAKRGECDDIWIDYDNKRLYEKIGAREVYVKLSEGKNTVTMKDKHGHKVICKIWKDTKKPKIKVTKKSNKFVVKVTDKNSGLHGVGVEGLHGANIEGDGYIKLASKNKRITSYTFTVTKKNCKKYSYYRKHGFGKHIWAWDRANNKR